MVDKDEINIITDFKEEYNFGGITFNNWTYYIQDYLKKITNQNNKSTFLQFTINDISFLITGDSEAAEATQIVNNDNINLIRIDVYEVPHHGSANSAGPNFLKKIEPKYCYISGTSSESEEPNWSKFDGGHPFPTTSALNNLSNYCDKELSLTGTPYNDNTRDLDNYNYSYEFKVKADKTFETITHKETILDSLN
ncbi:ComEC/Rec2 family competence protein [Spiroplasma taiwanense]|uniref:hypothetical protein n=1 Tax=Spiroplasma taiwanense TaxID=2145 RepID=UPI0004271EA5|nr:hypothetical protein [Spiroplasma taiwanense]